MKKEILFFPIPLDAAIFIVNVADLGYISFTDDLKDFIFNCGVSSLTGSVVGFSILSIALLNFLFYFWI